VRVQITERHCEVPQAVLTRTQAQIQALTKYEERASSADVVYTEEKHVGKVEVIMHVDGVERVVAHGEGSNFRSALDHVIERLRRMLREQRERRLDHKAPPLSERLEAE